MVEEALRCRKKERKKKYVGSFPNVNVSLFGPTLFRSFPGTRTDLLPILRLVGPSVWDKYVRHSKGYLVYVLHGFFD